MVRGARQTKLLELIGKYKIDTQEELVSRLREAGYNVTQATVSRDLKELNVGKAGAGGGFKRYVAESDAGASKDSKFTEMFKRAVLNVDCAVNMVVVKTLSGSANIAGMMLDSLQNADVLGCVAGDDTVFAVLRTPEAAQKLCDELRLIVADWGGAR